VVNDSPFRPVVSVVTSHGRQPLEGRGDERLIDLMNRHRVPWSAVSVYVLPRSGPELRLAPDLDTRLDDFEDAAEVLLYFNRNVNPFLFSLDEFTTVPSATSEQATEYFYQRLDNAQGRSQAYLKKLSPQECQQVVADRVAETVRASVPAGSTLVVGVSGGGDSNALLHGLSRLTDHGLTVRPVILMGIPDWDQGVPRARELCQSYGLPLTVIEEPEVRTLLGIPVDDPVALIDRFEREFTGDDFEFLGTLLIRLALSRHARELGTPYICTGLNLEDVLCEALYRISTGLKPAAFPARVIGDVTLVMPLWQCPKRIIDGCFPRYSLDNYDARYPCFSLGRNLYYSVIYAMQSQFPAFVEQLVRGLSESSMRDPVIYTFDDQLGFHVEREVPFPLLRRFQRMLGRTLAVTSAD
jgi:tRNA(Ile)-lysidine synthase TilS/MesJ